MPGEKEKIAQCPHCESLIADDSRFCKRCGNLLTDKADTLTYTPAVEKSIEESLGYSSGESFGPRYRIIEEIARGGMGCVYKAEDKELDITVALKMIRPTYSSNPRFIQSFKKEILLARSVSHDNVVRIHDLGEVEDIKFISMDYIKGQDLKDLIHTSGTLSVETTINITKQICDGLNAAHQKNIIHLDLKPRNIMIDHDGNVYIMDFGIARSLEAPEVGPEKKIIGTPAYISPEQAKGGAVDQRSDIYSLGIIIFEMLTGKRPFEADTLEGYIQKHVHEPAPLPSHFRANIPQALERIILKCLAKNPENRYKNCQEIVEELRVLGKSSILPHKPTGWPSIKTLLILIFLLLILAVPIYFLLFNKRPSEPVSQAPLRIPIAVLPFQNNSTDPDVESYKLDFKEMMITDLEQSKFLYVIPTIRLNALLKRMNAQDDGLLAKNTLDRLSEDENIQYFIQGNYTKFRDTVRFTVKIVKPFSYETLISRILEFSADSEILDKIDELTIWVKTNLGFSRYEIINDFDENVKSLTRSQQALQLYFKGRRYYFEGEFDTSIKTLDEAVAIDPQFAMAYRDMASCYGYLQDFEKAKKYAKRALDLALEGHGSLRNKLLIQAYAHYFLENSPEEAIAAYQEVLKIYPEDKEAHSGLASIYRNMRQWDLAEKHFLEIQLYEPDIVHDNLAWIYSQKGQYAKAVELLETNRNIINPLIYNRAMALVLLCQGKINASLEYALKIHKIFPDDYENIKFIGNIYQIRGDLATAREYYLRLQERHDQVPQSYYWESLLKMQEGRFSDGEKQLEKEIEELKSKDDSENANDLLLMLAYLRYQNRMYSQSIEACEDIEKTSSSFWSRFMIAHLKGLNFLELDQLMEAEKEADNLKSLIENQTGSQDMTLPYYHHLKGMIHQKKGDLGSAIKEFNFIYLSLPYQNSLYDSQALFVDALAKAHYLSRNSDQARRYYQEIQGMTTGRLSYGEIYVRSHFWLGKIFLDQGEKKAAATCFQTFLQLWSKADSSLPEIVEAREFLSRFSTRGSISP